MVIQVVTTDNKIWNEITVASDIAFAMSKRMPFEIDLLSEGPDLESLGFYNLLSTMALKFDFLLEDISINTANMLEKHNKIKIKYQPPMQLISNAKEYTANVPKNQQLRHFGLFVGRSNAERLKLAAHLNKNYRDKSILSYHFNINDDFHTNNIGLDQLVRNYNLQNVSDEAELLSQCPIKLTNQKSVQIDKSLNLNPAQQLLAEDCDSFMQHYRTFFIEIVCESYFSGQTFFPTEKIFRPILLKTPFIVQGAQYFLHRMRDLGFKTFNAYWDEGYAEDPSNWQLFEIIKVIDSIAQKPQTELYAMYQDMLPILEHNYQQLQTLSIDDFKYE